MLQAVSLQPDGSVLLSYDGTECLLDALPDGALTEDEVAVVKVMVPTANFEGYSFKGTLSQTGVNNTPET